MQVWRNRHDAGPDAVRRSSHDLDELLRQRLTEQQRRELDASRARIRRQVAAGEPVTDAHGRPIGQSEPRVLVPLDELRFDDTDPEPAG